LSQYRKIRGPNLHKMLPIPVFNKGDRYVWLVQEKSST
jgi:hypothetical protein